MTDLSAKRAARARLLAAFSLASSLACATQPNPRAVQPPSAASIDSALAVATFDSAWSTIHRTYYDSSFRGLDWAAIGARLRPRAAASNTVADLRATIREMLAHMGESHFALIPGDLARGDTHEDDGDDQTGDIGIEIRIVDGAATVSRIDSGGPALAGGVRLGWIISEIAGFDATAALTAAAALPTARDRTEATRLATARIASRLAGSPGSAVDITFIDGDGRPRRVSVTRRQVTGEIVRFGNLPPLKVRLVRNRIPRPSGCVGYITFNIWLTPVASAFDGAMQELADCSGIVLDLRGNPGGIAGLSMGIAGYFVDSVVPIGVLRTRGSELRLVTNPRRVSLSGRPIPIYERPLALLVDDGSVSTSEIFAAGMQFLRRARVFGDTTSGQALPALARRLPNDDILMHVFSDYTLPDGTRLEARGVIPDEVHPLKRADLLAGRDAALWAAVNWVTSRNQP